MTGEAGVVGGDGGEVVDTQTVEAGDDVGRIGGQL